MSRLILASASPRRRELLKKVYDSFEVIPAIGEEKTDFSLLPSEIVQNLALHKAKEVAALPRCKGAAVLGADTLVALGTEILGKPKSPEHAREMLRKLSGRTHEVLTGVCLIRAAGERDEDVRVRYAATQVTFYTLSEKWIDEYVAGGSPMDKAGGYGIQDGGLVERICGSYSNVVGLPLELLSELFETYPF